MDMKIKKNKIPQKKKKKKKAPKDIFGRRASSGIRNNRGEGIFRR